VKAKEVLQSARHIGLADSMLAKPERVICREIERGAN